MTGYTLPENCKTIDRHKKTCYYLLLLLFKKGRQCKAVRERLTPYQSNDPGQTMSTYIKKEMNGNTVSDKKGAIPS